jgi:hypothetical protein
LSEEKLWGPKPYWGLLLAQAADGETKEPIRR